MNVQGNHLDQPPILPELEHLLLRAARRRAAPRFGRRRWILATAAAALLLAAAAAAAATGVFHIADGQTSQGTFSIESRPVPASVPGEPSRGSICLQLRYDHRDVSYGCGDEPTAAKPFGLLIADSLEEGSRERVVYGLVASDVYRVRVLGDKGEHTDTDTETKTGLPGRFFAVLVPHLGRIELVGYDAAGNERARIGSLAPPASPPHSKAEAMAQGDPAGFAPTAAPPSAYIYKGKRIDSGLAFRLQLACLEGGQVVRCYDSVAELEANQKRVQSEGQSSN